MRRIAIPAHTRPLLNIGCGTVFHEAWINIDLNPKSPHVIHWDTREGLPFEDNTLAAVYHAHVLEHMSKVDGEQLLKACYRVLQPGGVLRVVLPDLAFSARLYLDALQAALAEPDSQINHEHYEWALLNLIDQMVRVRSGGEMVKFFKRGDLRDVDFIVANGGGIEAHYAITYSYPGQVARQPASVRARLSSGIRKLRRLWGKRFFTEVQAETRFRRSGEIHKWMYDEYALTHTLRATGFQVVHKMTADHSHIQQWETFYLDQTPEGADRRPGSLYIEATKPDL